MNKSLFQLEEIAMPKRTQAKGPKSLSPTPG